MKCPKCQREHTLKRAENNTVVCAACGSRFPLKSPAPPAAPSTQTPVAPPKSRADLNPQYLDKLIADGKRADAPPVDDALLTELLAGAKRVDDAPVPPPFDATYPPTPPKIDAFSTPQFQQTPFADRPQADATAQTENEEKGPGLFSWSGRATQREFLGAIGYYLLYSLALGVFLGIIFGVLGALSEADSNALRIVAGLGMIVVGLAGAAGSVAVTLILLAASARRLRDAGLSPYLTLLHFVVSLPFTIFLAVYPGQTGQADAQKSESRPQTPQAPQNTKNTQNTRSNAPQSAPAATSSATNGWLRFFSWNAPARPTDLPVALGIYALTAVWLVAHLFFEFFFFDAVVEYFSDHDWLDSDAVLGHVVLNFLYLVFLFVRLAIFTLNVTAVGVSILTLAKGTRK
ncbi:MAG: DUF805 domain-containing protein [Thermoguttaceae bacterium]|nr:DUF805 domain-containing protein [Thermoguttaceae bacterium]